MQTIDEIYSAEAKDERRNHIQIVFQQGPIQEVGVNGCHVEDVIDVLVECLRELNVPPLNNRETSLAIQHLETAGNWLLRRRMNRMAQGVHGSYQPHTS